MPPRKNFAGRQFVRPNGRVSRFLRARLCKAGAPCLRVGVSPFWRGFFFHSDGISLQRGGSFSSCRGALLFGRRFFRFRAALAFLYVAPLSLRGSGQGKAHRQGKVRKNGSRLKIKTRARESDEGENEREGAKQRTGIFGQKGGAGEGRKSGKRGNGKRQYRGAAKRRREKKGEGRDGGRPQSGVKSS